ncbi:hypothetical protein Glove_177g113 [Diversispora epigaea]|uniref:Protein kinase domain-containing protein n=1 Tax=Diversispora epigaea TaxID=1348612 RepID=A0A397IXA5_9GLOM|nr:hypothetical protein Glove_177g113 [Diversispora epigaea]
MNKFLLYTRLVNKKLSSDYKCPECNQYHVRRWCKRCNSRRFRNDFNNWTSGNDTIDKFIQEAQINAISENMVIEWIPYDRFKEIEKKDKGGFGTIYRAKRIDGSIKRWNIENQQWERWGEEYVALKKYDTSLNEDFLNEIAIHSKAMSKSCPIQFYGITQDPETNGYIMVLEFMDDGNLRNYLRKNFNKINWKLKLGYLQELVSDFKNIHKLDIIHQDFHPGNILSWDFKYSSSLYISDFGISKLIKCDVKNPKKRKIFGVLPYMAPEVLCGEKYTKAADVYSFGIIAYEIVTGFAPYYNIPHDKDLAIQICNGLRPKIPFHVPKLIARLIMRCWDARVSHRPTFKELKLELSNYRYYENLSKNLGLTNSTTPTPMNYEPHPEAIYTSRLLNYSCLPKPKNTKNFENELKELTKSALSVVASEPVGWKI